MINDWNNLTSGIVENSSLNSFKSAVDKYFMTVDLCFIVNVIIISVYYCMYLNGCTGIPALTLNHNHNHNLVNNLQCLIATYFHISNFMQYLPTLSET